MITILSNQGTATPETALCSECDTESNRLMARKNAKDIDDINETDDFSDCTGNEAIECSICGKKEIHDPHQITIVVRDGMVQDVYAPNTMLIEIIDFDSCGISSLKPDGDFCPQEVYDEMNDNRTNDEV